MGTQAGQLYLNKTEGGIWRVFTAGGLYKDVVDRDLTMVTLTSDILSSGLKILLRTTEARSPETAMSQMISNSVGKKNNYWVY